jgi:hypothetical protein
MSAVRKPSKPRFRARPRKYLSSMGAMGGGLSRLPSVFLDAWRRIANHSFEREPAGAGTNGADLGCPLHYPTRRFQGVAFLTCGCSAQAWEANSAESCVLNVRFISSSDSSAGGPEGLNTQAHSEQPHPSTFCPSIHTNSRDEFSW